MQLMDRFCRPKSEFRNIGGPVMQAKFDILRSTILKFETIVPTASRSPNGEKSMRFCKRVDKVPMGPVTKPESKRHRFEHFFKQDLTSHFPDIGFRCSDKPTRTNRSPPSLQTSTGRTRPLRKRQGVSDKTASQNVTSPTNRKHRNSSALRKAGSFEGTLSRCFIHQAAQRHHVSERPFFVARRYV